jgi:hypothetical protein
MGSVGDIQGSGSIKDWLDYGEEDTRRGKGTEKYEMTAEDISTLRTALNRVDENTTFSDRQAIRALYNKLAKSKNSYKFKYELSQLKKNIDNL